MRQNSRKLLGEAQRISKEFEIRAKNNLMLFTNFSNKNDFVLEYMFQSTCFSETSEQDQAMTDSKKSMEQDT